jgi:hypothetical protein
MSVVPIRCPTCGSAASSTASPNEYVCDHCKTRFQIVRPSDGTIVTDAIAHHCPTCGRSVHTIQSFRCTECGRIDFCESCVTKVPTSLGAHRFVCRSCATQKGWMCSDGNCGDYGTRVCVACSRRACEKHISLIFAHTVGTEPVHEFRFFSCETCGGEVCMNCVESRIGIFRAKSYCSKCHNELRIRAEVPIICKVCDNVMPKSATVCSNCGRFLPPH